MPCASPDLALDLPATPAAPGLARQAIGRLPLPDDQLDTATLLASELVTNAVRHAGTDRPIRLEARLRDRRLRLCVTDEGRGFSPPARPRPAGASGGYGLFLVEQLSHQWGVIDRTVWFELRGAGVR